MWIECERNTTVVRVTALVHCIANTAHRMLINIHESNKSQNSTASGWIYGVCNKMQLYKCQIATPFCVCISLMHLSSFHFGSPHSFTQAHKRSTLSVFCFLGYDKTHGARFNQAVHFLLFCLCVCVLFCLFSVDLFLSTFIHSWFFCEIHIRHRLKPL